MMAVLATSFLLAGWLSPFPSLVPRASRSGCAQLNTDSSTGGDFASLLPSLPTATTEALAALGVTSPSPIQLASLQRAHAGESLLLHAETGSGKSLAFLLPTLARLGLAGLAGVPGALSTSKVLIITPTRELGVQLANEAALVLPAPGAVQIVAVGSTPAATELLGASVVACTAPELLDLLNSEADGGATGVVDAVLSQVRCLILDELDMLLPVSTTYGTRAAQRKKAENKKGTQTTPAEEVREASTDLP